MVTSIININMKKLMTNNRGFIPLLILLLILILAVILITYWRVHRAQG